MVLVGTGCIGEAGARRARTTFFPLSSPAPYGALWMSVELAGQIRVQNGGQGPSEIRPACAIRAECFSDPGSIRVWQTERRRVVAAQSSSG